MPILLPKTRSAHQDGGGLWDRELWKIVPINYDD